MHVLRPFNQAENEYRNSKGDLRGLSTESLARSSKLSTQFCQIFCKRKKVQSVVKERKGVGGRQQATCKKFVAPTAGSFHPTGSNMAMEKQARDDLYMHCVDSRETQKIRYRVHKGHYSDLISTHKNMLLVSVHQLAFVFGKTTNTPSTY
jgi:hypothetical protein